MAPAIHLRSAVALAGQYPLLAGLDLEVSVGEAVLLRGANGAGKSSLLRLCAGLVALSGGEGQVLGYDLYGELRGLRPRIGLLGHASGLYDDLTVEDNVRFQVRAGRRPVSSVGPAMALLGLDGRLRRVAVAKLSAGQRRRTAIAALVARDPELWLLDEPHAGLDAEHRDLLDVVVRAALARGATVLLASHEAERAGVLAERTVTIAGGAVVADSASDSGPPVATVGEGTEPPASPVAVAEAVHHVA
jgi:heme ABC exporter ATP-binding subunit CcmA